MNTTLNLRTGLPVPGLLISPQLRMAARLAWDAIERFGQRRAAARLRLLAIQCAYRDAALAHHLLEAADACAASGRAVRAAT